MILKGKVILRQFGVGSKSQHEATYLETSMGDFVLRKTGENPFQNDDVRKFANKYVVAEGELHDYTFIATELNLLDSK